MVYSAASLPGLYYHLRDVIVMNTNGCNDFDTCGVANGQENDDYLFWVKDNDGPDADVDAKTMGFKVIKKFLTIKFPTKMRIIKTAFFTLPA